MMWPVVLTGVLSVVLLQAVTPSLAVDDANTVAAAEGSEGMPAPPVEIYTTPSCPYCKMLRRYLDARGIEYIEHNIAASEETRAAFYASGAHGVPLTVIGDQRIQGFNPWRIGAALRNAQARHEAPQ